MEWTMMMMLALKMNDYIEAEVGNADAGGHCNGIGRELSKT